MGSPPLSPAELASAAQVESMCFLARLLSRVGGVFSFENPQGSLMFDSTPVRGLMQDVACYSVTLDQCAFSLRLPGGAPHEFCKKRTKVVANFRQIAALERACPGVSPTHTHVHALGSRRVKTPLGWRRISLAKAAGRYPARLCDSCSGLSRSLSPRPSASSVP